MTSYLLALAATLLVEAVALALATRGAERRRVVVASLFLNLLTHPLACLCYAGTTASFAAVELAVFAVEAAAWLALERCTLRRALLLALVANLPSALLSPLFA